jgi:hypothetical protein
VFPFYQSGNFEESAPVRLMNMEDADIIRPANVAKRWIALRILEAIEADDKICPADKAKIIRGFEEWIRNGER